MLRCSILAAPTRALSKWVNCVESRATSVQVAAVSTTTHKGATRQHSQQSEWWQKRTPVSFKESSVATLLIMADDAIVPAAPGDPASGQCSEPRPPILTPRDALPSSIRRLAISSTDRGQWFNMLKVTRNTQSQRPGDCSLCLRRTEAITSHHLYPQRTHIPGRFIPEQEAAVVMLCWPCHCIMHRLITHERLAGFFHSIEAIKVHRGIKSWLRWARQQPMSVLHALMIQPTNRRVVPISNIEERTMPHEKGTRQEVE
ncbi:hypothetical protein BJ170DRAFT_371931 [Xylariales sp. AK1849]|nr:hypothetical protein BJ170DRAFT_371931 [Xylariales sp. AK1849]